MFKFFKPQCDSPTKGDWVSNEKKNYLDMTFEDITQKRKNTYQKLVIIKVRTFAFNYLLSKVKSKGQGINYNSPLVPKSHVLKSINP